MMLGTALLRQSRAAYAWASSAPNFPDFQAWVANMMGVPQSAMPDVATLQMAYDESLNLALDDLATIPYQPGSPSLYALAVYNLGGAILVDIVQDVPPATYWADLRKLFGINDVVYTIITGASDQGTSKSSMAPAFINQMSPTDFWMYQTPWGKMYMTLVGSWGSVWGLS